MIQLQSIPRQGERILSERMPEMVVLLDPDRGEYYSLDEIGGRVWELCDGTQSIGAIAALLCAEYDVSGTAAEADVLELLSDLASVELIRFDA